MSPHNRIDDNPTVEDRAIAASALPAGRAVDEAVFAVLEEYCYTKLKLHPFSTSERWAFVALEEYIGSVRGNTYLTISRHFEKHGDAGAWFRAEFETSRPEETDWWDDSETFEVSGEAHTQALAICRMILCFA